MITPPTLHKGDIIDIVSPANFIQEDELLKTVKIIENMGFKARVTHNCLGRYRRYSGTLEQRITDFKFAVRNCESKAILCSCGGYGSVQLIEHIADDILLNPKWLIGFSDISSIHALYVSKGIKSIHASMCRDINEAPHDKQSNVYLRKMLLGEDIQYEFRAHRDNVDGYASGRLVGGNLSVLSDLIATPYDIFSRGNILFVEDINEKQYKIERMFYHLKYTGVLESIKGLIVGQFVNCDSRERFLNIMELVLKFFPKKRIPICFDAPVGHISDNYPLIIGCNVEMEVAGGVARLKFNLKK